MNKSSYKLTFLPLFKSDMLAVVDYIANTLNNPDAAQLH
jgi:hypothetical protein